MKDEQGLDCIKVARALLDDMSRYPREYHEQEVTKTVLHSEVAGLERGQRMVFWVLLRILQEVQGRVNRVVTLRLGSYLGGGHISDADGVRYLEWNTLEELIEHYEHLVFFGSLSEYEKSGFLKPAND